MSHLKFSPSPSPSLGVEIELALVHGDTMALHSGCPGILRALPAGYEDKIKSELMQCYIETNSNICRTAAEAEADLREKLQVIQGIADE